jgi:hypothetical protein
MERGELSVSEDGGPHLGDRELQLAVAGAVALFEQRGANAGKDFPIGFQSYRVINIALGNAAAQMAVDVLQVLRLGAVDVTREVEVVVVLRVGDFLDWHHAGVARITFILSGKDIYDAMDVLLAEAVFRAVLHEALGGVDHQDAFADGCIRLVEH